MSRHARQSPGFTLIEIVVVVAIMATIILVVPPNLYLFGARSRLDNSANTLVSTVAAAREQAIIDGHPVKIELAIYRNADGEKRQGHRLVFTNIPLERSELLVEDGEENTRRRGNEEEEWLTTTWHELGDGVEYVGVSERADHWVPLREDDNYIVAFGPDGSVEKAFAIRLVSNDLEVTRENKTITVVVNPLTAEAYIVEGLAELPESREENEFQK